MADKKYIDRPPRVEPQLPAGVFNIPNPPDTESNAGQLLQQAFLPMIMIFGYILASLFGQGRNMLMMIPMFLSVIATVACGCTRKSQIVALASFTSAAPTPTCTARLSAETDTGTSC